MNKNKYFYPTKPLLLESGESIDNLKIAYQTFGTLNEGKSNVIWAFHALSANANVLDWWPGLFGENEFFNPEEHYIICANVIGSPYGSSTPEDRDFPFYTVRDVVEAHLLLADNLGINRINVAIGGSFGGHQVLEFAYKFSGRIDNLILLACSAKESAYSIAIHQAQRMALMADQTFGSSDGGAQGLKAARAIGLITYRTIDAYIETQTDEDTVVDNYKASSYIQYQGDKFEKRFTALSYYYLSKCLDTHNIGRNRGGDKNALGDIPINTLIIGLKTDMLIPTSLQMNIHNHMPNSTYEEIDTKYGHDGFLIETKAITNMISKFLK